MSKILLISDNEKLCKNIEDALNKNAPSLVISIDENAIINYVEKSIVSLVIVDEAVKSLDENGQMETVDPTKKNQNQFLRIDKHGNFLSNFLYNHFF